MQLPRAGQFTNTSFQLRRVERLVHLDGADYAGGMARLGDLFPGRKLQHEGNDQDAIGRKYDPGGPLDLDRGVVFLAPPEHNGATDATIEEDTGETTD